MKILRLIKIVLITQRFGLNELLFQKGWLRYLRCFRFFNPFYLSYRKLSHGTRLRLALERLGPIFIKFGQVLSTRYDALPEDLLKELAKLRDQVPAFSSDIALRSIADSLQKPITDVFSNIERKPLASASIAQVHSAALIDGTEVVIKILRPNIKKHIQQDLQLLKLGARTIEYVRQSSRHFKPVAMVEEIESFLLQEVDLILEAGNAEKLKKNMCGNDWVHIPRIHWEHCSAQIMVMERIHGIPIADKQTLLSHHIDLPQLAKKSLEIFFSQIFRDRFFHADLHPGNIFVDHKTLCHPRLALVDFGITGHLNESDQRYIAKNLLAFIERDYHRVAVLHVECGWVPSHTKISAFEAAIRHVSEPILNKPLKEVSFGLLILRLIQTAKKFEMNVQPQLLLLQKTLLNIEGICRSLDPDMNLWDTVKPIIKHWLRKQASPGAFLKKMKDNLPYWLEYGPELPRLVNEMITQQRLHRPAPAKQTNTLTMSVIGLLIAVIIFLYLT